MYSNRSVSYLILPILVMLNLSCTARQTSGDGWLQYSSPTEAGFSTDGLTEAKAYFDNLDSETLMLVHKGKVVFAWGDPTKRYRQVSIRKSYLSALFGKEIDAGTVSLDATLADLGIDDIHNLTDAEKQAKVIDLMATRSGIYLPSAYMPRGMVKNLPERGSAKPGERWFYNNWDFNTLGTVYRNASGRKIGEAFSEDFAKPLGMEDFRLFDTYSRVEERRSSHPAYLFKMSARDMARFGQLYLNGGTWNGKRLVSKSWIETSWKRHVPELPERWTQRGSYGLLWWISKDQRYYYASGANGQRIAIFPDQDMVLVHVVDNYQNNDVAQPDFDRLVDLILAAKTGPARANAATKPFRPSTDPRLDSPVALDADVVNKISGEYRHRFVGRLKVEMADGKLVMRTGIGSFHLVPQEDGRFWTEDIRQYARFEPGNDDQKGKAQSIRDDNGNVAEVVMYY